MSFTTVARLYTNATKAAAHREAVDFPPAARFAKHVKALSREVQGDAGVDEQLGSFLRRSRRVLRLLTQTPLSFNHPAFQLEASSDYLRSITDRSRGSYPDRIIARADLCADALSDLGQTSVNPVGDLAVRIIQTAAAPTGFVVQTPLASEVAEWLQEWAPDATLVSKDRLHKVNGYKSLVFIGPSCWYPSHALSAPRAERLWFVHYAWLLDREVDRRVFAGSSGSAGVHFNHDGRPPQRSDNELFNADELVPTVNWEALAKMVRNTTQDSEAPEMIEARLYLLAGGKGVYLETTEGATVDTVDVETDGKRLHSSKTRSIETGDYIVLRTEGGTGDYIPEVANRQLGKKAAELRALQRLWKDTLRKRVLVRGFSGVERDLVDLGIASPNLRYRIWHRSIRTQDPRDFQTLMEYLDLGDRADVIWTAMEEIDHAHRKAGQEVRRQLERAFEETDLDGLIQVGRLDVSLDAIAAGKLSAIRVEARSPDVFELHEDEFRVLLEVDEDLWHG